MNPTDHRQNSTAIEQPGVASGRMSALRPSRRDVLVMAAAAGACSLGIVPASAQPARSVTAICDDFLDGYARINPTMMGRVFGLDRSGVAVTDWSPAGADATTRLMRETLAALQTTPAASRKEKLGAAFVEDTARSIGASLDAGEQFRKMSTHIFIGPPALLLTSFELMSQATSGETPLPRETADDDWSRILERMRAVPKALGGYRESLEVGLARNLMAPRSMTLAVAEQCRNWAGARWFKNFAGGYRDGALAAPLQAAAGQADEAYGLLAEWLTATYAPKASQEDGLGADRFRIYADLWLGLKGLDLDEAYGWATEDYLRIEAEKAKECGRIRPGASFDEIRVELDRDPNHTIAGVDAFRQWGQDEIDKAISRLNGSEFDIPAQLQACRLQMTESGGGAMPYYLSPPEDFSAPGGVVWPTLGKTTLPTWSAFSTIFHESVPGHHIQLGGSRLLDLTRVQRVGASAGHAEGWALYAERLVDELGWFDTPQKRLSFLSMQSFRAARVVVDIGLHTGRLIPKGMEGAGEPWTAARAIALIDSASGLGRKAAALEVERYYAWPAQACCYKLGERTWLAARAEAMSRKGSQFNRRDWHAAALALGPLGLDRLTAELKSI